MKLTCTRKSMVEALGAAVRIVPQKTPKPILQCVKLAADFGVLTVTAYDLEVGLSITLNDVEIDELGEVLVSASHLAQITRECRDETMSVEASDAHFHIRGGDGSFKLVTQDAATFPPLPSIEGDPEFTVKAEELSRAIDETMFATARQNTRYAINGVLWERNGKTLRLVATDGRRLALSNLSIRRNTDGEAPHTIVPTKALRLWRSLAIPPDAMVDVRISSNQIVLACDGVTIASSLVEGHFPKYQDIIPKDHDKHIELSPDALGSAVRRAALLSSDESRRVVLSMRENAGEAQVFLEVGGAASELGAASIKIPVDYPGEPISIGFNPDFLTDALKACATEEAVKLSLKGPSAAGMLSVGRRWKYVVMPVNLGP